MSELRDQRIMTQFTPSERKILEKMAEEYGMSLGTVVRTAVLQSNFYKDQHNKNKKQ